MKKVIFEYDSESGEVKDSNGVVSYVTPNMKPFTIEDSKAAVTLQLVKQGISPDEIIKLRNNDLI